MGIVSIMREEVKMISKVSGVIILIVGVLFPSDAIANMSFADFHGIRFGMSVDDINVLCKSKHWDCVGYNDDCDKNVGIRNIFPYGDVDLCFVDNSIERIVVEFLYYREIRDAIEKWNGLTELYEIRYGKPLHFYKCVDIYPRNSSVVMFRCKRQWIDSVGNKIDVFLRTDVMDVRNWQGRIIIVFTSRIYDERL